MGDRAVQAEHDPLPGQRRADAELISTQANRAGGVNGALEFDHAPGRARHLAGVAVIGYADKPGKAQALADVQAAAVTTDLAEITAALGNTA